VEIQILHIEDCPNWAEAGRRLRAVLDATGHRDVEVRYRLLATSEEAAEAPFAGSPTILVDGDDLFPSEGRTADLACRVYPTGAGFAGLPTSDQLLEALGGR
jgi:hypothetical protein